MSQSIGEVWLAQFPYEEDNTKFSNRPVIVIDDTDPSNLVVAKITRRRRKEKFEVPISKWGFAGLDHPSCTRIQKTIELDSSQFIHKLGDLHVSDANRIFSTYVRYISSL